MKKAFRTYAVIWAIVLAVFNVVCFVTPGEIAGISKFGGAFWAGYIFSVCQSVDLVNILSRPVQYTGRLIDKKACSFSTGIIGYFGNVAPVADIITVSVYRKPCARYKCIALVFMRSPVG